MSINTSINLSYENFINDLINNRINTESNLYRIKKGCASKKRITEIINLVLRKNIKIKSINLSNCHVTLENIKMLNNINNLVSLNLHNSINIVIPNQKILFDEEISKLSKLELLDISSNKNLKKPYKIVENMKNLKILSMEDLFKQFEKDQPNLKFSNLSKLEELDISNNCLTFDELNEISKLQNLYLLYYSGIYNIKCKNSKTMIEIIDKINEKIFKLKNLEFFECSSYKLHIDNKEIIKETNQETNQVQKLIWTSNINYVVAETIIKLIYNLPKLKKLYFLIDNSKKININIKNTNVTMNENIFNQMIQSNLMNLL
jgi:hypothetical protein